MTANSFAEDVQASLDAGMNTHLSKPIVSYKNNFKICTPIDRISESLL